MKKLRGFTMIELVMVIVILSVIAAIGSGIIHQGFRSYMTQKDLAHLDSQGRLALERMARELRLVRTATALDLTISPTTEITFTDTAGDTIRFYRDIPSNTLMRTENANPTQPLSNNITSMDFTYYDTNGVATAIVTQMRYISVQITATQGNFTRTLRTTVSPRSIS